jgi:dTMP kinase
MTFDHGVLELMTPRRQHEPIGRLIGRIVETYSEVRGIEIVSCASTTFKRSDLDRAFEPDESYYIAHADEIRPKDEVDLQIDPPPDLVIEVEMTRSAIPKLLLFAASRAQLVREKIQPALEAGRIVISDRFLDSTTVYQGVARRIPAADTARINSFAVGSCLPDVTFLLDLERETSLARMRAGKREPDRIERESEEFFAAVRSGYLDLAKKNPGRVVVLDASQPVEALAEEIQSLLSQRNEFLFP